MHDGIGVSAPEAVFWLSALLVLYAYAGYPLLLLLAAALRPKKVRKGDAKPRLSVILVARDEERYIGAKLESCLRSLYPPGLVEILVASDGSSDRTEEIVRSFEPRGVRLLSDPGLREPQGKPAGINRAAAAAEGDVLVLTDARQSLDPEALAHLVRSFADPMVGAVSGNLCLEGPRDGKPVGGLGSYWKLEKRIRRTESLLDSSVGATGALYAVRRCLFRPLDPRLILDDVAVPMDVVLAGRRVVFEDEARVYDRIFDESAREYRRKVRTLAGNFQLLQLRPELLDPRRNRLLCQLVSHKLLRLFVPWLLLAMLGTSALLAFQGKPWYEMVLWLQIFFYALALAGAVAGRVGGGRFLALPYSFVLLNLAAAHALVAFARGRESSAWKKNSPAVSFRKAD